MPHAAGVVRPARRPPGWRAPGPAPRGAEADSDAAPRAGEDLCYLAGDWRILQRVDGHRWSLDDLVTAWFATVRGPRPPARFADLGCGIGTVLMLIAWRFPRAVGVGVEAQVESVALARRSLEWNGAGGRCVVRHGDLRDPGLVPEGPVFDLVTGTPPYLRPGTATESRDGQRGLCHFEHRGGIEDYCAAAARLLAPGGRFVVCAAAAQAARVRRAAAAAGLGLVASRDVVPRAGKAPLFTVHALGRVPAESPAIGPPLTVRDGAGRWTDDFRAVRAAMGMPVPV